MDRPPEFIGEKIDELVEHRDQLRSWAMSSMHKADQHRQQIGGLKVSLQESAGIGMNIVGPQHGPSPEYVAKAKREIEELEKKTQAAVDEYARRVQFANTADHILNITRDYLKRLPEHTALEPVKAVPFTNHDHRKSLDLIRREVSETQARLGKVRTSPPPPAELEAKLAAWVKAKGNAQRVQVRAPRHQPLDITWHSAIVSPLGPSSGGPADALTLQCRLHPEAVLALLLQEYGRQPNAAQEGMTDEEHDEQVEMLTRRLDELGRSEEALIVKLLQELPPHAISRRLDAQPDHILGCRVGKAARGVRAAVAA